MHQYEQDKFSVRFLFKIIAVFFMALVAIYFLCFILYREATGTLNRANYYHDVDDLHIQELQKYESNQLHSYGYLDKNRGVVRIPIEQAMTKIIKNKKY